MEICLTPMLTSWGTLLKQLGEGEGCGFMFDGLSKMLGLE